MKKSKWNPCPVCGSHLWRSKNKTFRNKMLGAEYYCINGHEVDLPERKKVKK